MKFWDASAILPLLVHEAASQTLRELANGDPGITVWWGTPVECASALARRRWEGTLTLAEESLALRWLAKSLADWSEVPPSESVREQARRLVSVHRLRASDAFQLAAAMVWVDGLPRSRPLVTLDVRLGEAAALEGFLVLPASP